jgi:membrane peptidoglycan carboxypeptidase
VPTSPLDLANVAATLTSHGMWCPPTPILSVTDRNDQPVSLDVPSCEQVVPRGLADALAVGMSKDTTTGTAAGAADDADWTRPMLGKTGTTQDNVSAGFVGATPQYAGAVMTWSDATPPRPICVTDPPELCSDGNLFGATIPADTWFAAMKPLHEGLPVASLPSAGPRYLTGQLQ